MSNPEGIKEGDRVYFKLTVPGYNRRDNAVQQNWITDYGVGPFTAGPIEPLNIPNEEKDMAYLMTHAGQKRFFLWRLTKVPPKL